MRNLFSLVLMLVASIPVLSAEPARALGFEVGKATSAEVRTAMTERAGHPRQQGTSAVTGGELLLFGPDRAIGGMKEAVFVFDTEGRLVATVVVLSKDRYEEVLKALRSKYTLLDEQRPFVGNRSARLRSGTVQIVVDAPHLSFEMSVLYTTPAFQKQLDAQQRAERESARRRDAASF
ncbi:MAG: hypothetical protein IPG63_07495 [Xanthomonadales bacterium]|nr:hypothetical protein [Xanthomonadales bacterium]MCC6562017.1 hypothetical protein [Xanthomonadales bacterium]